MAQLGMVGLGRMGANLVRRLMRDGQDCVVYDVNPDPIGELQGEGATGASSLKELAEKLGAPQRYMAERQDVDDPLRGRPICLAQRVQPVPTVLRTPREGDRRILRPR